MQTHVKVLGALFLVWAAFMALAAIAFPTVLGMIGSVATEGGDPDAAAAVGVLGLFGTGLAVFFGVKAIACGITGYGVLNQQSWSRIAAIVLCAISLIEFPFGTAFGIYGFWVMFHKETEALFAKPQQAL